MSQNLINELTDRVSALTADAKGWEAEAGRLSRLARSEFERAQRLIAARDAYEDVIDGAILERIHEHQASGRDWGNKVVGDSLNMHAVVVKDARERLRSKGHEV